MADTVQQVAQSNVAWKQFLEGQDSEKQRRYDAAVDVSMATGLGVCFIVFLINLGKGMITTLRGVLSTYVQQLKASMLRDNMKKSQVYKLMQQYNNMIIALRAASAPYAAILQQLGAADFDNCPDLSKALQPITDFISKPNEDVEALSRYGALLEGVGLEYQRLEDRITSGQIYVDMIEVVEGAMNQVIDQVY